MTSNELHQDENVCMFIVRYPLLFLQFALVFDALLIKTFPFHGLQSSFECTDAMHLKLYTHCLNIMWTYSLKLLSVK